MADASHERSSDPRRQDQDQHRSSILEWLAAGLGLVLLVASLVVLGWQVASGDHRPPTPRIEVQAIEQQSPEHWLVRVRIHNDGEQTAAGLRIAGALVRGGDTVERSEASIDYLPSGATRLAGLFFTHDPQNFELRLRAEGYQMP